MCICNKYRNDPKVSDKRSGQTGEQSDLGLHCLLFHLHLFDEIP